MKRLLLRTLMALIGLCLLTGAALAQTEEPPATTPITYGSRVEGDLTDSAFWDWWTIQARGGDQMFVEMTGQGGLAPLIGILDQNGTLVARSDDGAPNSVVNVSYTTPSSGQYTLVTTRAGNQNGTTVGHYVLRLGRDNPVTPEPTALPDVTFQCGPTDITSAISLRFPIGAEADAGQTQQIIVAGIDGFDPAVRVEIEDTNVPSTCAASAPGDEGDSVMFPGETAVTSGEKLKLARATLPAQMSVETAHILIGSANGLKGRYLVILTGFNIEPASRQFPFEVRLGPRAAPTEDAVVYMLAADGSRVDPTVLNADASYRCDDAGKRDCAALKPVLNAGIISGTQRLTGHRFDSGMAIASGSTQPQVVVMTSFQGRVGGLFNIMVTGTLGS